jgi:hypothetical protein
LEKGSAALARAVTRRRQHFPNEFDAFAGQFGGYASDPGDISARPRKARDQARAHWIPAFAITIGISRVACFAA